jgi:uncharacterized membrane protein YphA (DoxX/SURF4 family)
MKNLSFNKRIIYTLLRMTVGWHFLYEGISKLVVSGWSSENFLIHSTGPFSAMYQFLASSPFLLKSVDFLNIYGLILIGIGLFIGLWVRYAAVAGIVLLTLYYFVYPPFGVSLLGNTEGHVFIVNKIFIEAALLLYLAFSRTKGYDIENLLNHREQFKKSNKEITGDKEPAKSRREALKSLMSLPVLGLMAWGGFLRKNKYDVDVISGATIQVGESPLKELKGELPKGKIGTHEISRLVLGGNLIGGWAHARDLLYVSSLFKAYNTEKKVYETLMLAEKAGINTINIGFPSNPLLAKYKRISGSRMKVISQVGPDMDNNDYYGQINKAIDFGADIIQVQGNWCDWLVRDHKIDVVGKMLDHIRKQGYAAGLASHTIDALIACGEYGIVPDYFMKTMHHDKYWSAHPVENRVPFEVDGDRYLDHNRFHDNLFCLFPDRTIDFVNRATIPVMGFKVLAAGAIEPEDGFKWAFEHGADFICVGMFDFQIVNNVNTTISILNNMAERKRNWFG